MFPHWLQLQNSLKTWQPWHLHPPDHVKCLWTSYTEKPLLETVDPSEEGRGGHLFTGSFPALIPTALWFSMRQWTCLPLWVAPPSLWQPQRARAALFQWAHRYLEEPETPGGWFGAIDVQPGWLAGAGSWGLWRQVTRESDGSHQYVWYSNQRGCNQITMDTLWPRSGKFSCLLGPAKVAP